MEKSGWREALDALGDEVMSVIAQGSPDAQRGKFFSDPGARQAALVVSGLVSWRRDAGRVKGRSADGRYRKSYGDVICRFLTRISPATHTWVTA